MGYLKHTLTQAQAEELSAELPPIIGDSITLPNHIRIIRLNNNQFQSVYHALTPADASHYLETIREITA